MRRCELLTAIAVLGTAVLARAADNLPPVPKALGQTLMPEPVATSVETEATVIVRARDPAVLIPAQADRTSCARCEATRKGPVQFLANELIAKPIYAVEKAMNDAEGRRLSAETCRLNREAERRACEAARLVEKVQSCPSDLKAKYKLLDEEADYAKEANRNAVGRAKLEYKQAEYCKEKNRLEAKHAELFPSRR